MSCWTYKSVTFAELVVETLRRWKSERDRQQEQQQQQDHISRLRFHFWNFSIGTDDLDFLRRRLEQQVPRDIPIELAFSHCTFGNSTEAVVIHLRRLVARCNLEALHFVERHASLSYPDLAGIVQAAAVTMTTHQHHHHQLKELTFTFQNQPGSLEILQAPGITQTMQTLTVDAMRFPMETPYVQELVEGLQSLPCLKCINLQGLACNDESLALFVQAVLAARNLQELKLDLTDGSLTYNSLKTLARLFQQLAPGTLVELYVWDTKNLFSDADQHRVDAFGSAVELCQASIRVFSLQDVGMQSHHLVRVFQALENVGKGVSMEKKSKSSVEITGTGFFRDPSTFGQLATSLSKMTGIGHIEIDDEQTYEEWDADQDLELVAALKQNPCIKSMSFWTGTTDRIDLLRTSTTQIFQRNRSLTTVSQILTPSPTTSYFSLASMGHLLKALSKQAGPCAGDPVYQVLRHSVHLLWNSNKTGA